MSALKQSYLKELSLNESDVPLSSLRLFCMGKELKEDLFLYSYDINEDMVVQAMFKKI